MAGEFNKELDSYLSERVGEGRKSKKSAGFFRMKVCPKEVKDEIPHLEEGKITVISEAPSFIDSVLRCISRKRKSPPKEEKEGKKPEAEEMEFEAEEKEMQEASETAGLLDKISGMLSSLFRKQLKREKGEAGGEGKEIEIEDKEKPAEKEICEEVCEAQPARVSNIWNVSNLNISFIKKYFRRQPGKKAGKDAGAELSPDVKDIISTLVKTNVELLKRLKPRKLEAFRSSEDFRDFRDAVQKYKDVAGLGEEPLRIEKENKPEEKKEAEEKEDHPEKHFEEKAAAEEPKEQEKEPEQEEGKEEKFFVPEHPA